MKQDSVAFKAIETGDFSIENKNTKNSNKAFGAPQTKGTSDDLRRYTTEAAGFVSSRIMPKQGEIPCINIAQASRETVARTLRSVRGSLGKDAVNSAKIGRDLGSRAGAYIVGPGARFCGIRVAISIAAELAMARLNNAKTAAISI